MLLATRCPLCHEVGPAPCGRCIETMEPAPALPPPPGLDAAHALLRYDGTGRELVARLKYRNARASVDWLATGMAALVADAPDLITWIPTSRSRRLRRGFDQAELLAAAVAERLGRPAVGLLTSLGSGPQTGRSRSDRLAGPDLSLTPIATMSRFGSRSSVLVVDDVVTTGATATAAARALRSAGFGRIVLVVAASTPPSRRRRAG